MKQFAVIGLGRFGSSVAKTLTDKGNQVLAIDIDEDRIQEISEIVTNAVCIDATDEKALKAVGIENVDVAVVSVGAGIEASILITLALKEIGVREIIAKAITQSHGKVLLKIGATRIVFPEQEMGERVANMLISPKIIEHIYLSPDYSMAEVSAPREFVNRTIKQIDVRAKYGLTVIAIKRVIRGEEKIDISPPADEAIKENDILIVVGSNTNIERLKEK